MSKLHLIVNPVAGKGRARNWIEENEGLLREKTEKLWISYSSKPGDATSLAKNQHEEAELVAAVGGDGTINEVVNGMDRPRQTLVVIPAGSGNDLVKSLGISDDPDEAAPLIWQGSPKRIDCGRISGRLFVNSLAMGIDGAVARFMNSHRWLPTRLAYHAAVLVNLFSYSNRSFAWKADGVDGAARVNMLAVMNGHTYGGGYRIAPAARVDDGKLDFVVVGDYGILGRMRHLPKVKTGAHLDLARVEHKLISELNVVCHQMPPVAMDGELIELKAGTCELMIDSLPGELAVMMPVDTNP